MSVCVRAAKTLEKKELLKAKLPIVQQKVDYP